METVIMGNMDGDLERLAFDMGDVKQVINSYGVNLVSSKDEPGLQLELGGHVCPVLNPVEEDDIKPHFIILKSGVAFNASDYQVLFNVREVQDDLLSGTDVTGHQHFCRRYGSRKGETSDLLHDIDIDKINKSIQTGILADKDVESLKSMIKKMRDNDFFELLTYEFSGKIKEVARELIEFRKEIQERIEPDIVTIASRDIPEASNQLEGINETLEDSTMKIMDVNEAQMDLAGKQVKMLESLLSGNGNGGDPVLENLDEALDIIRKQASVFKEIGERSLTMMQPLSFQDLVGQRIQKIIKLVRSMEFRIEDLIVSFGIKIKKHREDPLKSFDDLSKDVDIYMTELKGPQKEGTGLDQAGIDDLLDCL